MSDSDFTAGFTVQQSPEEVFSAINNVRGWWTGEIEGSTDSLDDVFTYRFEDIHYSKQRITELVPHERVVWLVEDSYLKFVDDPTEWNGTEVVFELTPKNIGTEIRFTHHGLVPAHECFDACSSAWGFYVHDSLRRLITNGDLDDTE